MAEVEAVIPFVPARDFEESTRFYEAIGFTCPSRDDSVRYLGMEGHGFLLQDFYVKDWADNFMMNIHVADATAFVDRIRPLIEPFDGARITDPELEDWGMIVAHLWDPTGVLWHITQNPPTD